MVCATVADESLIARAIPKSITLTWPVLVIMMLPGLMSRWTTPARCEYSSAVRMPSTMRTASLESSGPALIRSLRSTPSTYSLTMNGKSRLMAVRLAHGLFSGVEDADDRRVRHAGRSLRLLAEARAEGRVCRER